MRPDPTCGQSACDECLARPWLLGRLGGHLERVRGRIEELLALPDDELVAAVGGRERDRLAEELSAFDPAAARRAARRSGLGLVCRCAPAYPGRLLALRAPPAVLHVAGGLERLARLTAGDLVAVVGTRRPSPPGREVARGLGRGLAASGIVVVSGLAFGVDGAAHEGACAVGGPALAVVPSGADRAYPAAHRRLRESVLRTGGVVSELVPGQRPWRWTFTARNRILAGIAMATVVVEAGESSGALLTAACAAELGRTVAAVPGPVALASARGSNGLLAHGARFVRDAQDVLDLLGGARPVVEIDPRGTPSAAQRSLLGRIAAGSATAAQLAAEGSDPGDVMSLLAELELEGWLRRGPGGRYTVLP